MSENNEKKLKIIIGILSVIIVILVVLLIVEKNKVSTIVIQKEEGLAKNNELQQELDSLMAVHNQLKEENSEIASKLSAQDSVIMANAAEIQKLIATQGDYNRTKRKLELLRKVSQGYVAQMDSLIQVNKVLTAENTKIKGDLSTERENNANLSREKQDLTAKVTTASMLKAYNVKASSVKLRSSGTKESETDKAKRVDRININFTLSENLVATSGTKTVYARIARPDNVIVSEGNDDIYSFMYQGQKIQYSIKKEINYQNKAMDITLSWNKKDDNKAAMKGKYNVSLFIDGYEIGQTSFELK
jgi:hypothetical protein